MNFIVKSWKEEDIEWLEKIAHHKWKRDGRYRCLNCSNTKYAMGKSPYSRKCTKCKYEESVLAGTVFHGMKIPISKAMAILESLMLSTANYVDGIFEDPRKKKKFLEGRLSMQKGYLRVSSVELAKRHKIQQKTAWSFLDRIISRLDNTISNEDDIEAMGEQFTNFRSWYKWITVERTAGYAALFMLVLNHNIKDTDRAVDDLLRRLVEITHGEEED